MTFHTVEIKATDDNEYDITAINNETIIERRVGSIAFGDAIAGLMTDDFVKLDAAEYTINVDIIDFTDEYGYTEAQLSFSERPDNTDEDVEDDDNE